MNLEDKDDIKTVIKVIATICIFIFCVGMVTCATLKLAFWLM